MFTICWALNILTQYPYNNPIRWCSYGTHFTDKKTRRERNSSEATWLIKVELPRWPWLSTENYLPTGLLKCLPLTTYS